MFENAGGQIKVIAKFLFVLEVIGSFFLAKSVADNVIDMEFLVTAIVFIAGVVVSYLSVIAIIAFGELVENSSIIAENVERIAELQEEAAKEKELSKKYDLAKTEPNADHWVCSKCGKLNHKTVGTCGCGNAK